MEIGLLLALVLLCACGSAAAVVATFKLTTIFDRLGITLFRIESAVEERSSDVPLSKQLWSALEERYKIELESMRLSLESDKKLVASVREKLLDKEADIYILEQSIDDKVAAAKSEAEAEANKLRVEIKSLKTIIDKLRRTKAAVPVSAPTIPLEPELEPESEIFNPFEPELPSPAPASKNMTSKVQEFERFFEELSKQPNTQGSGYQEVAPDTTIVKVTTENSDG